MSEQVWLFPPIHGAIATLRGHAAAISGQNPETLRTGRHRHQLPGEGQGGEQWAVEQQRLNARAIKSSRRR